MQKKQPKNLAYNMICSKLVTLKISIMIWKPFKWI